jgi:hypothetical protein
LLIPVFIMSLFFIWKSGGMSVAAFVERLIMTGALTSSISVSVFANVFAFLLFNRLDMLKASKGILGMTIIWAVVVFIIKLA